MSTRVIVVNGGSSSGKSGLVRCLQAVLPQPWLAFGIDRLIEMMPAAMRASSDGIDVAADGTVSLGSDFHELEQAWTVGVAATARAGASVLIDDVFLGGAKSQQRWLDVLGDLPTLWVGVHCDPAVAAGREIARGDRAPGMAVAQAAIVHQGVRYDVEVDTSHTESLDCARIIAAALVSRIRTGQVQPAIPSIAVAYNQYPPSYGGYQQPRPTSGECVAGMVLGIIALVTSLIPFVGLIGVVGLILSIVGMRKARAEGRAGYGMGVAGLVCSIISLVPTVFVIIFFIGAAASCVSLCQ